MIRVIIAAALASAGFISVATVPPLLAQEANTPATTRVDALAQADQRFDRLDANKDGKLTPDEIAASRGPRGNAAPPPADGAAPPSGERRGMPGRFGGRMFARLDANGDGVVDREEYRAWAGQRFDRMDANKDGTIDADERQAARDAMMGRMGGRGGRNAPPAEGTPPPPPPAPSSDPNAGQ